MKTTIHTGAGREIKAIPLNAFPPEAWHEMMGGTTAENTPLSLYKTVPWLYRAIEIMALSVGSLPYRIMQGGEPVADAGNQLTWYGELADLFNAWAGDYILYGAAYALLARTRRRGVVSMRRLSPQSIKPVYDAEQGLTGFTRTVGDRKLSLALEDVVYVFAPNRAGEVGPGQPPAQAALKAAGALAAMDTVIEGLFQNGAIRPTIAVFERPMIEAEQQRVQSALQRAITGFKNAFKLVAVSTPVELQTVGEYPDRLSMPELTDAKRQDVCTALGIPSTLLFSDAANYATANQDWLNFYDLSVIPLAQRFCAALNSQVLRGTGYALRTAEDELELYQQFEADRVNTLAVMLDRGVITVNEFRERMRLDPMTDAAPDDDGDEPPGIADEDEQDDAREELKAWERFVLKRIKAQKPMREFETRHIPPALAASISGTLEAVRTPEQARAAFISAAEWLVYP